MEDLVVIGTKIESIANNQESCKQTLKDYNFAQGEADEVKKDMEVPKWVDSLIKKTFFGICPFHEERHNNELNGYCIDCDIDLCKNCILSGHHEHKLLKIYRYVYQDVVPVNDIKPYLDISKIQTYKSNKKWIVSFTPLPHNGSRSQCSDPKESCYVCKRKLYEPNLFRFCCIACKVDACSKKRDENNLRKRKRKGTPHRAPLF